MYKILIRYDNNANKNLWEVYGTSTTTASTASTSSEIVFTEFETDDVVVLEAELLKLDKLFGHDKLKVIKEIDANYTVDVTDGETAEDIENTVENEDGAIEGV